MIMRVTLFPWLENLPTIDCEVSKHDLPKLGEPIEISIIPPSYDGDNINIANYFDKSTGGCIEILDLQCYSSSELNKWLFNNKYKKFMVLLEFEKTTLLVGNGDGLRLNDFSVNIQSKRAYLHLSGSNTMLIPYVV